MHRYDILMPLQERRTTATARPQHPGCVLAMRLAELVAAGAAAILALIIGVAVVCVLMACVLLTLGRKAPASTWLALVGTTTVLAFVLIRAASFHHIDRFIGTTILGLRWNWILEMGGISTVIVASELRRRKKSFSGEFGDQRV